jgi:site-specific recombinase XerD
MTKKNATSIVQVKEANMPELWLTNPYIKAATSDNTRQAYQSDVRHFEKWGGRLPADPQNLVAYLQHFAPQLNPRTLARRITAIKHWHSYQGFQDPTQHPIVQKTLTGIQRIHGKPKVKAYPLLPEDLLLIVRNLHQDATLAKCRDNALLQLGFCGAFRRSELVNIHVEHLQWQTQGIDILIPQSKTDQENVGQFCGIPEGKDLLCPVTALKNWLNQSNITEGPIFRELKKGNQISAKALSPLSVNHILKKRASEANIPYAEQLSSHSMRRGFATSASRYGIQLPAIMRQGRWKQVNTVMEYVEASARFQENATSSILNKFYETKTKLNDEDGD